MHLAHECVGNLLVAIDLTQLEQTMGDYCGIR